MTIDNKDRLDMADLMSHPIADAFPLLDGEPFEELVADIRKHGRVITPIVIFERRILDGRGRARAAKAAGVELTKANFTTLPEGVDPIDFVASLNLHRRHLSKSQLEAAAVELANLRHGGDRRSEDFKPPNGGLIGEPDASVISHADAAAKLGVSKRNVERAAAVKKYIDVEAWERADEVEAAEIANIREIAKQFSTVLRK
jgi:hypothetical protein